MFQDLAFSGYSGDMLIVMEISREARCLYFDIFTDSEFGNLPVRVKSFKELVETTQRYIVVNSPYIKRADSKVTYLEYEPNVEKERRFKLRFTQNLVSKGALEYTYLTPYMCNCDGDLYKNLTLKDDKVRKDGRNFEAWLIEFYDNLYRKIYEV